MGRGNGDFEAETFYAAVGSAGFDAFGPRGAFRFALELGLATANGLIALSGALLFSKLKRRAR